MSKTSEVASVAVSVVTVFGFFGVMVMYFLGYTPKDSQEFGMLMGALITSFTAVNQYWIGSSVGSKSKDAVIAAAKAGTAG